MLKWKKSCFLRTLSLLVLCQCANHGSIEHRALLAVERSNEKELREEDLRLKKTREYLLELMIAHKNDRFPLQRIEYPFQNNNEEEIMAVFFYNSVIRHLSKREYEQKLDMIKYLVDNKNGRESEKK